MSKCCRCSEQLLRLHFNQRFCKLCAKIRNKEKVKEWNMKRDKQENWVETRCKICRVSFKTRRGSRKYCGYQCRKDSMKLRRLYHTISRCQKTIGAIIK